MTLISADISTLPVRFTGTYRLMEVPPRCRKPRPVPHEADFTLPVRSVTDEQAPIAITYATGRDQALVLRFFDLQLYQQVTHHPPQAWAGERRAPVATEYGSAGFPAQAALRTYTWSTVDSLEAVRAEHAKYLAGYLVVDGLVWELAREPRYVVSGSRHRSQWDRPRAPWVDLSATDTDSADEPRHIFRADQHAAALADALAMARSLGVDEARIAELTARAPQITVHVPAAVQLVIPEQEHEDLSGLRAGLRHALYDAHAALTAVDSQYPDPEKNAKRAREFAEAWEKLTDLHGQILALTVDVVGERAVRRPFLPQEAELSSGLV